MSVGFQAYSDTGLYQIDGLTPNFQMTQALSVVSQRASLQICFNNGGTPYSEDHWVATFTFYALTPLYAFSADPGVGVCIWDYSGNGSTHTVRIVTTSQATVRLFVFDKHAAVGGNFGLQIFDPAGKLIADAARPFYRVLDVIHEQYRAGYGWDKAGDEYPSAPFKSRSYGRPVLVSNLFPVHNILTSDGVSCELSSVSTSGDTVTWGSVAFGKRSPRWVGFRETWHCHFIVIDGTGLI
ncbi:hypothetical protein [Burkholderia pseudomallei]|uniref:hypothetical protein n=1 Tax=Burkholderia pseudomallei TaxID=28450 RepID=UPI0001631E9E|nr:hypothetical protein [Burkholderia pseudomallei]AIS47735.1 putative gp22 [Burkholderia pseudomallei]KGD20403.1 putative gp22 [Burkholderia pseudomallei]ONE32681.1 hypothetical protein AQ949_25145 [Burkholderia pseudomallei]ONE38902.1 hypothetical protein AQ950_12905 [Burkholderia pseudomallei]CAJ2826046.1 putative gp22 [Burkholderia pseudomallei]